MFQKFSKLSWNVNYTYTCTRSCSSGLPHPLESTRICNDWYIRAYMPSHWCGTFVSVKSTNSVRSESSVWRGATSISYGILVLVVSQNDDWNDGASEGFASEGCYARQLFFLDVFRRWRPLMWRSNPVSTGRPARRGRRWDCCKNAKGWRYLGVGENNSPRLAFRNICSPVASQEKSQSVEAFTHGRDFQDIDTLSHSYSESEFLMALQCLRCYQEVIIS